MASVRKENSIIPANPLSYQLTPVQFWYCNVALYMVIIILVGLLTGS